MRSGLITPMVAALDVGDIDFVLAPIEADLPAEYVAEPLADERLVLLTAPAHRLAGQPRVAMSEARGEPFVSLPAGTGLRALLDGAAADAGFVPRVKFEASTPSSIRELVSAGLGVAMLPASATRSPGAPVNAHEIEPALRHPPYGIIHRRDRQLTPAARMLSRHLVEAARRHPAEP